MMRRLLLCLVLLWPLASCGSNTGFEIQVTPNPEWIVPTQYYAIQVTVTAETTSVDGENDQPQGGTYSITATEQPPYVIIVLQGATQYAEAKTITVTLLAPNGSTFQQQVIGDVPFTQGQLKPVPVNWNTQ